jgi:hypothetical protein
MRISADAPICPICKTRPRAAGGAGYLAWCRECRAERYRAKRKPLTREQKDAANKRQQEWRSNNKDALEKARARSSACYHIPLKACQKCGSAENVQRHHEDYSKPLDITFLCKKCHTKEHHWDEK